MTSPVAVPEFDRYMPSAGRRRGRTMSSPNLVDGDVEVMFGETRQDGSPVATFVAAIRLDSDGRISRYIVGRSPAVLFELERG